MSKANGPYSVVCVCHEGHGHAKRVTTQGPDRIVVRLVCDICQREWDIIRTDIDGLPTFKSSEQRTG